MPSARLRYSKPVSAVGGVVSTVMAIAGLAGLVFIFGFHPEAWPGGLFLCLWTFVTGFTAYISWKNVFTAGGYFIFEAEIPSLPAEGQSPCQRLQSLQELRLASLISESEFQQKREEILRSV